MGSTIINKDISNKDLIRSNKKSYQKELIEHYENLEAAADLLISCKQVHFDSYFLLLKESLSELKKIKKN